MSGFNEMNEIKEISGVRKIIIAGCIIAILLSGGGLAAKFALKAIKQVGLKTGISSINVRPFVNNS